MLRTGVFTAVVQKGRAWVVGGALEHYERMVETGNPLFQIIERLALFFPAGIPFEKRSSQRGEVFLRCLWAFGEDQLGGDPVFLGGGLRILSSGNPEAAQADHEVTLEEHLDGEGRAGRYGFFQRQNQMIGLSGLTGSRPAGRSVPVGYVRGLGRPSSHAYFSIGARWVEYLLFFPIHPDRELAQEEVALAPFVVATARSALRQTVVGQNLEPKGRDRLLAGEIEVEDVPLGDVAGGKDRSVLHHFELGQVGLHCGREEGGPERGVGFFLGPPCLKSLFEAFDFLLQGKGLRFDLTLDLLGLQGLSFRFQKEVGLVDVVEQGHQTEVLVVGDGVVLVSVALGAARGQSHPDRAGGGDPVDRRVEAEFERIDPSLLVELGVSVKPGGGFLFLGGVGQHVAGELLDGELVVGHIAVESPDYPVAVGPNVSRPVLLVAIAIGIAR